MNTRLFLHLCRHELFRLRWQVAAAFVVSTVCLVLTLRSAWTYGPMRTDAKSMMLLSSFILSISNMVAATLFGMHAATGERTAGTHTLVRALPISTYAMGAARLLASMTACIFVLAPMSISVFYLSSVEALWLLTINLFLEMAIFLWIAALGLGRSSALSAAVAGWIAMIAWGAMAVWLVPNDMHFSKHVLLAIGPPFHWWFRGASDSVEIELTALALIVLAISFVLRYKRALEPFPARHHSVLRLPRMGHSYLMRWPLIWKTVNDLSPLGILALPWGMLIAVSCFQPYSAQRLFLNYIVPMASLANFLLPMVIGVHLFVVDQQPGLNRFWRSHAISPHHYFSTRVLGGLIALTVFLWVPTIAAVRLFDAPTQAMNVPFEKADWLELLAYSGMGLAIYLYAVGFACWLRHTIYSGILSIGAPVFVLGLVMLFAPNHRIERWVLFTTVPASCIAATALAAWSVTRDRHWSGARG